MIPIVHVVLKLLKFNLIVCRFPEHESCLFVHYDQRSRVQHQSGSGIRHRRNEEEQEEEELAAVSKNLSVLLREQESSHSLKKYESLKQSHKAVHLLLIIRLFLMDIVTVHM